MLIFDKKKKFDYPESKKKKTSLADYFIIVYRVRGVRIPE